MWPKFAYKCSQASSDISPNCLQRVFLPPGWDASPLWFNPPLSAYIQFAHIFFYFVYTCQLFIWILYGEIEFCLKAFGQKYRHISEKIQTVTIK